MAGIIRTVNTCCQNCFSVQCNDIFKVILQERTSPEIANEINRTDFLKSRFLKSAASMTYIFTPNAVDPTSIDFVQEDNFDIKNISGDTASYFINVVLTSSVYKNYSFDSAGYTHEAGGQKYKDLFIDDFNVEPIPNLKKGNSYTHRDGVPIDAQKTLKVYRTVKACFADNKDGIDDYFFTMIYMMPFTLSVKIPDGYDFNLFPTFPQDKLKGPFKLRGVISYNIPFLMPGQGFSFSLVKNP